MRDDANGLTAAQLAWCRTEIRSFAPAEASVLRRDADVAANHAYFRAHAAVTPEAVRDTDMGASECLID